jgi:hypothetical protein
MWISLFCQLHRHILRQRISIVGSLYSAIINWKSAVFLQLCASIEMARTNGMRNQETPLFKFHWQYKQTGIIRCGWTQVNEVNLHVLKNDFFNDFFHLSAFKINCYLKKQNSEHNGILKSKANEAYTKEVCHAWLKYWTKNYQKNIFRKCKSKILNFPSIFATAWILFKPILLCRPKTWKLNNIFHLTFTIQCYKMHPRIFSLTHWKFKHSPQAFTCWSFKLIFTQTRHHN